MGQLLCQVNRLKVVSLLTARAFGRVVSAGYNNDVGDFDDTVTDNWTKCDYGECTVEDRTSRNPSLRCRRDKNVVVALIIMSFN